MLFSLAPQALSVGIFPYVLKLLQSSARELRPLLVFIWAKILAVDSVSTSELGCFFRVSAMCPPHPPAPFALSSCLRLGASSRGASERRCVCCLGTRVLPHSFVGLGFEGWLLKRWERGSPVKALTLGGLVPTSSYLHGRKAGWLWVWMLQGDISAVRSPGALGCRCSR